jgi:hypothetical protein
LSINALALRLSNREVIAVVDVGHLIRGIRHQPAPVVAVDVGTLLRQLTDR